MTVARADNEQSSVVAEEKTRDLSAGPAGTSARHVPALDGIRGVAILWVMLHNVLDDRFHPRGGPLHVVALLAHPGWIGVQLFFALSGFLITAGLLDTQGAANYFSGFYARRALRILPLYYGVLFASLVVFPSIVFPPAELQVSVAHQGSLWLFISNWTHAPVLGFVHFWSLGVEEQFYLLWPLLVYRLSPRRLLTLSLAMAAGALVARCAMVWGGASAWAVYTATTSRLDALTLGAAGACLVRIPSLRRAVSQRLGMIGAIALGIFLIGVPLTAVYNYSTVACETVGYTLLAVSCAVLVTGAALDTTSLSAPVARILNWKVLRSCGKYSYAMYVFHELLHVLVCERWIAARFPASHTPPYVVFIAAVATFVASYGLAFVSYHAFEKRFLALKRFVRPSSLPIGAGAA